MLILGKIAFNLNGSIFFNLRFYEQVFANDIRQSNASPLAMEKIINFYFLVVCHELSHNIYPMHDIAFMDQMHWIAVEYMSTKERYTRQLLDRNAPSKPYQILPHQKGHF